MKKIIFNLKREWYDKIASGEKMVEYRKNNIYWTVRLSNLLDGFIPLTGHPVAPADTFAVFRLGYGLLYPDIIRRITKIDIGPCPYDGWDGDYYRISFEGGGGRTTND